MRTRRSLGKGKLKKFVAGWAVSVSILSNGLFGQATPAAGAAAPAPPSDDQTVKMEAFVATGTRFNDRTVTESPVPIDVVTTRELVTGGYTETSQMLQAAIPSFNFPRATISEVGDVGVE